ncbi:MAG TPA: glycerol-3-phosphate dehydrogenase [Paucimonas sp.]|nr:glycerol-3-phosphate dehydrogenase [Paucimonas sp.]
MRDNQQTIACDVLVVGGGINGAGIARDAAGRGLSVVLCDKDDLAAHTSSASTKLIHGGLRYLEHYEFRLVRKALAEREVLLRAAPHLIAPLCFVMPHDAGQRPAWMIRAGLFLYDNLAKRELLPGSRTVDLRVHETGAPLKPQFTRGFMYADGWVDDARLVVVNALDAAARGATVLTRTACVSAVRNGERWHARLQTGDETGIDVQARCLVNAAGPWVTRFAQSAVHERPAGALRLVKGSHIVVKKLFDHPHAYIFQHPDGRIVFAIPYQRDFTLIGTTDVEYRGDPDRVAIERDEIEYLCALSARYFRQPVTPRDVIWTYSGVRPLLEDEAGNAAAVTRDYRLAFEPDEMLLSVFGGKLTTYRKLAEEAVDRITAALGHRVPAWTANACLPGGDLYCECPVNRSVLEFDGYVAAAQRRYPWLPPALVARYVRAYGTRLHVLLDGRSGLADMGPEIVPGLYEAEADYLMRHEWARCAEDILWRRSKLGLHLPKEAGAELDAWIAAHPEKTTAAGSPDAHASHACLRAEIH